MTDKKLVLFGIWTFPNQNAVLINGGNSALMGISFTVYELNKDNLKEVSDVYSAIPETLPNDSFFFSNIFKQNFLPIYGTSNYFIAIYDDHDITDSITRYKFFIFDYSNKVIINPSVGFSSYKVFSYDVLSFMSYKLGSTYYVTYVYNLENVTSLSRLQYQIYK